MADSEKFPSSIVLRQCFLSYLEQPLLIEAVPLVLGNECEHRAQRLWRTFTLSFRGLLFRHRHQSTVPRTALRHLIEHPSHAPKQPQHRPRIPKKVGEPLLFDKTWLRAKGYGLYIQERICWRQVFVIEAVFATACMIFAVIWCIKTRGGIQDGFAIAGTGIAYVTTILGAWRLLLRITGDNSGRKESRLRIV